MPVYDASQLPVTPPDERLAPASLTRLLAPYIAPRRRDRIKRVVERRLGSVTALVERPYDVHNAAAVMRTAEALGLCHLHLVPHEAATAVRFSKAVTQNADKWLDVYVHSSVDAALERLGEAGFLRLAAVPPLRGARASALARSAAPPVDRPLALVFGNEHDGLTPRARALCDDTFHLPMYGFSESLNLSVSAALALRDVSERRRAHIGREGDLPPWARERLTAAYFSRAVSHADRLLVRLLRDGENPRVRSS